MTNLVLNFIFKTLISMFNADRNQSLRSFYLSSKSVNASLLKSVKDAATLLPSSLDTYWITSALLFKVTIYSSNSSSISLC